MSREICAPGAREQETEKNTNIITTTTTLFTAITAVSAQTIPVHQKKHKKKQTPTHTRPLPKRSKKVAQNPPSAPRTQAHDQARACACARASARASASASASAHLHVITSSRHHIGMSACQQRNADACTHPPSESTPESTFQHRRKPRLTSVDRQAAQIAYGLAGWTQVVDRCRSLEPCLVWCVVGWGLSASDLI